ncbi:MAG: hypothetical protein SPL80_00850 [Bacilli bacterium]|nr:hypothetical protein [Bacilli bacterium]
MLNLCNSALFFATQFAVAAYFPASAMVETNTSMVSDALVGFTMSGNENDLTGSSTQKDMPLHNPFYDSIANEMLSFLRDEDDLDFREFEQQLKDFLQYNELPLFCSFLLGNKTDNDITYFIKGVIETDIDIYSNDWFKRMLSSILNDDSSHGAYLRHVSQVLMDEYF